MMGLAEPFRGCTELRIDLLDLSLPFFFYVLAFFSRFHCTTYMTNDRNNKRMPMAMPGFLYSNHSGRIHGTPLRLWTGGVYHTMVVAF